MKRLFYPLFILAFCLLSLGQALAQNANLVLYAEAGEGLQLILNGATVNPSPNGQIKLDGLAPGAHNARIIVSKYGYQPLEIIRTIYLEPGMETYFNLKLNNNNEYVLRPMNQVAIASLTPPPGGVTNASVNTPPRGTRGAGGNNNTVPPPNNNPLPYNPAPVYYLPGYNGPVGCPLPMDDIAFGQAKQAIASKSFESTKLLVAQQVLANNCLLISDIKAIMLLFTFESTRLEFAKFAYARAYDLANYYQLYDAFTFESSITELNDYIAQNPPHPINQPAGGYPVFPTRGGNRPAYTGKVGCQMPMADDAFNQAKQSIGSKTYDSTRLTVAKQVLANNCLYSSDVKEIMQLFDYESTRLEFAKFAYSYTYDVNNYYVVNDAFQYESSITTLNSYIKYK